MPHRYHPTQRQPHITPLASPLYVLTAVSNPQRFASRYRLYQAFEKMCADGGAVLYTVELALGERPFEVTTPDNPRHLQLRSAHQLWHKENQLNLLAQRLPPEARYIAILDADTSFVRSDWALETCQQLQHHPVVQMWSHAIDLGPQHQPIGEFQSFAYAHNTGAPLPRLVNAKRGAYTAGGHLWHPGYAWAFRRDVLSALGGLGDIGILGSSDHHMACAFVGRVHESVHGSMSAAYKRYWQRWQERARKVVDGDLGYVEGTLLHNWHGSKKSRQYVERWQTLVKHAFDPETDILRDMQGLWQFAGNKPRLRDDIRRYFQQRNEDSVDT